MRVCHIDLLIVTNSNTRICFNMKGVDHVSNNNYFSVARRHYVKPPACHRIFSFTQVISQGLLSLPFITKISVARVFTWTYNKYFSRIQRGWSFISFRHNDSNRKMLVLSEKQSRPLKIELKLKLIFRYRKYEKKTDKKSGQCNNIFS